MGHSIKEMIGTWDDFTTAKKEDLNTDAVTVELSHPTNVVSDKKLRKIQSETLEQVSSYLAKTFGPMGSNTKIIVGNNKDTITSSYSKDGLKVLKNISNSGPIEASIIEELIDITRHVETEVGDGTTSTVILSNFIFKNLLVIQKKYNIPPYRLIRLFKQAVDKIKKDIQSRANVCTIDDIYDISMISTNGNEEVSENIKNIYSEFGMNVDLSVAISNNSESYIKSYDGLTITEGYDDPVYINNRVNNTSEIHNAKIFHFQDPIDTMDMIQLFEQILENNIYEPLREGEAPTATVICCPRVSKDLSASLKELTTYLYSFDTGNSSSAKPPILIVTNIVASDEIIMDDIANLCGCKTIKKYIDPKIYKMDQESGKAPTLETICDFAGEAELVISDSKKTKFINPKNMKISTETGDIQDNPIYTAMINFLQTEINSNAGEKSDSDIGLLKKRLAALQANMAEYLVGGVTVAERDSKKDLIEDAIKNCRSASVDGWGYAANFEALLSSYKFASDESLDDLSRDIFEAIFHSYFNISRVLYGTVETDHEKIDAYIEKSIELLRPFNISNGELDENNLAPVKCSIMLDINILDTLSKIISIMVTCNQCLLQAPQLNNY